MREEERLLSHVVSNVARHANTVPSLTCPSSLTPTNKQNAKREERNGKRVCNVCGKTYNVRNVRARCGKLFNGGRVGR